jgi:hypothetical protein
MIGYHCRQRLVRWSDTPQYFSKKCLRCGRVFTQRKRQPVGFFPSDGIKKPVKKT